MASTKHVLLSIGNPLLDMQVRNGEALLEKYGLKANDAVLANEQQQAIYEDLQKNHEVTYVAGGAGQNAARCAQYVLPAESTVYLGCVGTDALADQLRAANDREGLTVAYQVLPKGEAPTGACAVVITGHHRSLCTNLAAAERFSPSHLEKPEVAAFISGAKFFYLEGFFLTHGLETFKILAKHAVENNKVVAMNLSAPFIPQFFKDQVDTILPYVDILIGNESEASAYAESHQWEDKDYEAIARKLASSDKVNKERPRLVLITQGADSTVAASASLPSNTKVYPVTPLPEAAIVDTNGAGDAFAGGFLGAYVLGKTIDEAVEVGHRLGQMCVGQVGPQLKWPKENVL